MRKIFIDGGGNDGSSIELFIQQYPGAHEFEIHSFEPHPEMFKELSSKATESVKVYKLALSDKEGNADFFLSKTTFGSTLNESKQTGGIGRNGKINVKTVDLSSFLVENFTQEDYIVLKLDIEGAEYPVLSKLINTGTIKYINKLYGEWHQHKLANIPIQQHNRLIEELRAFRLEMKPWDALAKDFTL